MDAIELINNNLDVQSVLEHYNFNGIKVSGNYIRSCCKVHDGNNDTAFVANYETGLWTCHTGSCGSGNMFQLVQKIESISFPEAVHRVAGILKLNIGELEIVARTKEERTELREFLKAIESSKEKVAIEYTASGIEKKVKKYKEFDLSTIEHFNLTYFEKFNGRTSNNKFLQLNNVLGFPLTKGGALIGYSLRATTADADIKWTHQPPEIKTGEILYNYENAIGKAEVVVVEGITDVWAYHEIGITAVATYGARITEEQEKMLLRLGANLVFSFDGDDAGRLANKKAYELFNRNSNIKFVAIPDGSDPENIKRGELEKLYEQKTNYVIQKDSQPITKGTRRNGRY